MAKGISKVVHRLLVAFCLTATCQSLWWVCVVCCCQPVSQSASAQAKPPFTPLPLLDIESSSPQVSLRWGIRIGNMTNVSLTDFSKNCEWMKSIFFVAKCSRSRGFRWRDREGTEWQTGKGSSRSGRRRCRGREEQRLERGQNEGAETKAGEAKK